MKYAMAPGKRTVLLAALLALLGVGQANAAVLYSTLGPGDTYGNHGWFVDGADYFNQVVAMPFAPNQTADFQNARMALGVRAGPLPTTVNVYLETDAAGMPGAILEQTTVTVTASRASGGSLVTATSALNTLLLAGTQYWLVLSEPDPTSQVTWFWTTGNSTGPIAFNEGGSPTGPWDTGDTNITAFDINGNAPNPTPEPASLTLLGLGALGMVGYRLRRRTRA